MTSLIDTVVEDDRWQAFGLERVAQLAGGAVLAELGLSACGYSICVMGCDDARIKALNSDFRAKPVPTNVLSWPTEERRAAEPGTVPDAPEPGTQDDPEDLGDLALAWETCALEATEQEKSMHDHVTHLVVHGILHLLGYDHADDADARLMENTERRALARLGIADPY